MKQYKTRKPNQNLACIIFLQSKSQRHIAIKCQHSPSSSSRDKYAINISNSSHDSDKTLPMYSKEPLSSKTCSISSIFDDFLGFRAHLQVFECFCKFSSHDFTVPQISAAQINATARTNEGLWKSQVYCNIFTCMHKYILVPRALLTRGQRSATSNLVPRLFPLVKQRPWSELVT